MWTTELVVIAVMIAVNSVFAAYEIALASVNSGRLQALLRERRRGAAAAIRMKDKIEASLAVVQLGITVVGAIAAATGGAGAAETIEPLLRGRGMAGGLAEPIAISLIVAPLTIATILFGELVPKVFALRNKEWVCLTLSPGMLWFSYSVWPAVWFLDNTVRWIITWNEKRRRPGQAIVQEDSALLELRGAATAARMSRLIGHREAGIIVSASHLANTPLRRIMLPAEFIGMLTTQQSLSEALIVAHQEMHTRFPVTEVPGDPQGIIGYVNFKDIVSALRLSPHNGAIRNLIRRLRSFNADLSAADCLEQLMRERNHIALVRDHHGLVIGLITLEDIVEELVGEIHDEFDRLPAHLTPLGNGWVAGGFVSLADLRAVTGLTLSSLGEKPVYTVNDWILERLGRTPRGGDEVTGDGCRALVRKTRQTLVQEAFLSPIDPVGTPT